MKMCLNDVKINEITNEMMMLEKRLNYIKNRVKKFEKQFELNEFIEREKYIEAKLEGIKFVLNVLKES